MRQVVITRSGGVGVLKVRERPEPRPRQGEVAIRVRAAGLNFADVLARQGIYPDAPAPPCVVGYEVAGMVEAAGDGVDPGLLGTAVVALTRFGGQSEVVAVPVDQIFAKPAALSFEEAAALPVNYLTAYALLVVMGSLRQGEGILIHNAGGGVGLAALDIARHIGAVTYGTASVHKHAFLRERGLDHAIDYRTQDWLPVLRRLTNGGGVELVIDPLGGAHWRKSYRALSATGRLGMFGISTASATGLRGKLRLAGVVARMPWFHPIALLNSNKGVFGLNLAHLWHEKPRVRSWMEAIMDGVREGWVRPHVDRVFPFEHAAAAHAYLEARQNIGKVVLVPR